MKKSYLNGDNRELKYFRDIELFELSGWTLGLNTRRNGKSIWRNRLKWW